MKLLILVLFSFSAWSQSWVSNKDHSEVLFKIPYMTVSELTGRFGDFEATAELDSTNGIFKTINVKIFSSSVDTGNKMRDGHLKGNDFFESDQHPHMIFVGKKITKNKVEGILTIKNISKPASFEITTTDSVKDTWGYENKFVKFKGSINRKDFNITWNKTLDEQKYLVGNEITLWGVFQMQPFSGKTPPSKHMIPDTSYIREREEKLRKKEESESGFAQKFRKLINGK